MTYRNVNYGRMAISFFFKFPTAVVLSLMRECHSCESVIDLILTPCLGKKGHGVWHELQLM